MVKRDADSTAKTLVDADEASRSRPGRPPAAPDQPLILPKATHQNIRVSPAVLDAALKDGDELLRYLQTAPGGITQMEAESRAHNWSE